MKDRTELAEECSTCKNSLQWQIIKQNDAELSVFFFFRIETIATQTISKNAANIDYSQFA